MNRSLEAVAWWERRRLRFNLAVLAAGAATTAVAWTLEPGDPASPSSGMEAFSIVAGIALYAVAANACYCLGWATELLWSGGDTARTAPLRPRAFRLGLWFAVAVTLLPAALLAARAAALRLAAG
jgi:hypothetical protein